MAISKQTVKNCMENEKELMKQLESKIERQENWKDFKSEFSVMISKYANNPTPENKSQIYRLIEKNYITDTRIAKDALDVILRDLGVREVYTKKSSAKVSGKSDDADIRRIYESFGVDYDIEDRIEERYKRRKHAKLENNTKEKSNVKEKKQDQEENHVIKDTLKKAYFKLTASILMAPGEVPPEILAENREMIKSTLEKLDIAMSDLEEARGELSEKNQNESLDVIYQDLHLAMSIQNDYDNMINWNIDEEALIDFEENLEQKMEECEDKKGKRFLALRSILEEVETHHKLMITREIKSQLEDIEDIIHDYDEKEKNGGKLDLDENGKRQLALKIARRKVEAVNRAGISKVIENGDKKSKNVIKRARGILLPELEDARDKDVDKLEKNFNNQEEPEI